MTIEEITSPKRTPQISRRRPLRRNVYLPAIGYRTIVLSSILKRLRYALRVPLFLVSHLIPADGSIWLFTAKSRGDFAENPKYAFLYASRQPDAVRPIWLTRDDEHAMAIKNAGYEVITLSSWRERYLALRAGVLLLSHGMSCWPYSGNSEIVQTYHGNTLKLMGPATKDHVRLDRRLFRNYVSKNWDTFVLTSDDLPQEMFESTFALDADSFLVTGYPRNDPLFRTVPDAELCQDGSVYELFESLSASGPLLCYMPTWRESYGTVEGEPLTEAVLNLEGLNDILQTHEASLILKLHPSSEASFDTSGYDSIYECREGLDIYPVLEHVDILITDYSSVYVDYLLLDRPIIFYPYDREAYEADRGFYFEYESVTPGPRPDTPEGLQRVIAETLAESGDPFASDRQALRDRFYAHRDGDSSKRLYTKLLEEVQT